MSKIQYLESLSSRQVLVPQMKFNCHGYITQWHAQLINNVSSSLGHGIMHFNVWRPSTSSNGLYHLVGSNTFEIGPQNSTTRIQNSMMEYFSFSKKPVESDRQIFFQPGDILGWFFSSSSPHGRSPTLGVMFRNSSNQDDPTTLIMKRTNIEPCEISDVAGDVQHLPSVVPYISVDYGKLYTDVVVAVMYTSSDLLWSPSSSCTVLLVKSFPSYKLLCMCIAFSMCICKLILYTVIFPYPQ